MSGLRINISKLSEGSHEHSLTAEPKEIGLDDRFNRTVKVAASLEKTNQQLWLQTRIQSGGRFTCDRCLDEFQLTLESGYSIVYVQGGREANSGREDDEVQYLPQDTNIIDLGEDVRQFLVLSLPVKLLCKEDCAGLCPVCGTNRNRAMCSCTVEESDPRWADLKRLLKN